MQYTPTLTDQKINSLLSIELPTRYVRGRMQYTHTLTDQKLDFLLFIESKTRYTLGRMQYAPTLTDQKFNSPLKLPTRKYPFSGYRCRGVLHTPHKCPWPWANDSSTRYVSIEYVFVESYTRKEWVCLKNIEPKNRYTQRRMQYAPTLTDQKFDFLLSI